MPPNYANQATRYAIPPIESGYDLNPGVGQFSAILPLGTDKTNLVINPSVEVATTGWAINGTGTLARDSTVQKFGTYSLKVTPGVTTSDGVQYDTVSLVAGVRYFASMWFKGQANLSYRMTFATTGGASLSTMTFVATGFWQRVSVSYMETATTTRRIYILKATTTAQPTNVRPYWVDGLQVEQDSLTTYLDGDMVGFVRNRADFYWTGTPHASTSVRIGQCRSGGKIVSLNELGFRLLSIIGLGMGGIVNQLTPLARGGAYYGGTVIADRQFTLVGQIDDASGYLQLARKRQALIDLFKPDIVSPAQPVILRYIPTDDCGNQQGNEQEIVCVYQDGMSGRTDNLNAERLGLQFQLYLPFVAQEVGNVAATLSYTTDITDADYAIARINGDWQSLGTGFDARVQQIRADPGVGRVYFGGLFATGNGVTLNGIGYWDTALQTFVAMGTGVEVGRIVYAVLIAPNHDVWIAGNFATVNGAATDGLARWNYAAGTWTAFNVAVTDFNGVYALAMDKYGTLFFGGDFKNWDGTATADYLASRSPAGAFDAVITGINDAVNTIAVGPDLRSLYIGGAFTTPETRLMWHDAEAGTTHGLAPSVTMPNDVVRSIEFSPSGTAVVGGEFTLPVPYIFRVHQPSDPDGAFPFALGSGVNNDVYRVKVGSTLVDPNTGTTSNDIYAGGFFTTAGGLSTPDRVALNSGSTWLPLDVNLPGTPIVRGIDFMPNLLGNTDLYLGFDTAGTAVVAGGTTVITNTGSAATGPRSTFTGPGRLVSIRNITTNKSVFFNYTLLDDETAVLDLTNPSNITFISSFRGNVLSFILAGSQLSQFQLAPGPNVISVFIDDTVDAGTSVTIQYRLTSHSLDAAIPGRLVP